MPLTGEYGPSTSPWARQQAETFEATQGAEAGTLNGVPIIVLLLYVAFAAVPAVVFAWNWLGLPEVRARDVPLLWRAVIALTIAYSAFLAEVFRAGLASVDRGQIEAAMALGLTPWGKALRIQGDVALARRLQRGEHLAGAANELV